MQSFFYGLTLSFGLIVAIGAQNAWVLSMSIRGQYPWTIAIICFSIDSILMAVGISSIGVLQKILPALVPVMTVAGIVLLAIMVSQNLNRIYQGNVGLEATKGSNFPSRLSVVMQVMSISLLNPHVYLDTVILIGSIGSVQTEPWIFWLGGALASLLWFFALAGLGRPLKRWLSSPNRWRVFDGVISFLLVWVAIGLYQTL